VDRAGKEELVSTLKHGAPKSAGVVVSRALFPASPLPRCKKLREEMKEAGPPR